MNTGSSVSGSPTSSWFCLPLQINDSVVTLPTTTQIPGVSVVAEDVYTIVTIKDEIQVKFESNNFLDVKIPASSSGKVSREAPGCVLGRWIVGVERHTTLHTPKRSFPSIEEGNRMFLSMQGWQVCINEKCLRGWHFGTCF